jgi:hypothetical protein
LERDRQRTQQRGWVKRGIVAGWRVLTIGESINIASMLYSPSTATWSGTGSIGATIINPIILVRPPAPTA